MQVVGGADREPARAVSRRSFVVLAASGLTMGVIASRRSALVHAVSAAVTAETVTLPGVPASVQVAASFSLAMDGNYRWQSTRLLAGTTSIGLIQAHHGFLIATDNAVDVRDAAGGTIHVPAGGTLALVEGQQFEVIVAAGQARIMIVELVAKDGAFPNEQPDSTKDFSVPKGSYTVATLHIPAGANAPKPASVVAKAAAPAIAVLPDQGGAATPGAGGGGGGGQNGEMWLVAVFPAV